MNINIFKNGKKEWIIGVSALILGLFLGALIFKGSTPLPDEHQHQQTNAKQTEVWTCSMHPQIRQDKPGKCPICGMDLVPLVSADDLSENGSADEVQMSGSAMKLAEIQTWTVRAGTPVKTLYLSGKVKADERKITTLTARFGGRIEKLYINFTGQQVNKGDKLASLYSPELNTAQQELLDAIKMKDEKPAYYRAIRNKLKLWQLSDAQIDALEQSDSPQLYFDILSPISGTVTRRDVDVGTYVKEGSPLFEVTDLSRVWVMFDAYESDLPWIKTGDRVQITMQALPGKTVEGRIAYIDPFIDAKTRVAGVRVELENKGMQYKPEMFAEGLIQAKAIAGKKQILIPKTAVLWTGKRAVVYVKVPKRKTPSFVYREIVLGPESGHFYLVAKGLHEGEEIAANGVFKIDASAQLQGKRSMMNPEGGKVQTAHQHGQSMSEDEMKDMPDKGAGKKDKPQPAATMKCESGKCGSGS